MRKLDYFNAGVAMTALSLSLVLAWFEYADRIGRRPHLLIEHYRAEIAGLSSSGVRYMRGISLTNVGTLPAVIEAVELRTDYASRGAPVDENFFIQNNMFDVQSKLVQPIVVKPYETKRVEFEVGTGFSDRLRLAWSKAAEKEDWVHTEPYSTENPGEIFHLMSLIARAFSNEITVKEYLGNTSDISDFGYDSYAPLPLSHQRLPCETQDKIMLVQQCFSIELTDVNGFRWIAEPSAAGFELTYALVF